MTEDIKKIEKELTEVLKDYIDSKKSYTDSREVQRQLIVKYLNIKGFKGSLHGGRGQSKYTSNRTLKVPFDLRSYKYITVTKDELEVFISLQPPEQDPDTLNRHTLIDRLGVRVYPKSQTSKEQTEKDFNEIKITEIDLPLTREKLAELLDFINNEIELIKKIK